MDARMAKLRVHAHALGHSSMVAARRGPAVAQRRTQEQACLKDAAPPPHPPPSSRPHHPHPLAVLLDRQKVSYPAGSRGGAGRGGLGGL